MGRAEKLDSKNKGLPFRVHPMASMAVDLYGIKTNSTDQEKEKVGRGKNCLFAEDDEEK